MDVLKEVIRYIAGKMGCVHPFRVSRILVLANWVSLEEKGYPIIPFRVEGFEAGFYIDGFREKFDDECFVKREDKKCLEYKCPSVKLDKNISEIIDRVLDRVKNLSDEELNRLVIRDPRYRDLLSKGGFETQ